MTPDRRTAGVTTTPTVPNREATTAPTDTFMVATADQRRQRIGLILDGMIGQQDKLLRLVSEAKEAKDHLALGYPSWTAYVAEEFKERLAQLNRDDRRSAVFALTATGLSTRAIAPIVNVDHTTVVRDLMHVAPPVEVVGLDDQVVHVAPSDRPEDVNSATTPAVAMPGWLKTALADHPHPTTSVVGIDGKTYRSAAPTKKSTGPRRRPLPDSCRDLAHDLHRITARVNLIAADDRLEKNRDVVAARLRHELGRAITAAQSLMDLLTQEEADS